ncbi:T9SS type A sorting domain-containing protein [Riemerella anatipestifer]|uniref:T9SS type A sorting domain-containing protein n=1 Tax=Riemerella anatipestifer TaxID=34085 RepID=UPI001AD70ADC|nr:T9SS type A sorting domain-containing protein [Riemerella anatipestifer]MBO4234446.1 T9SS type A sorting domain-containing protein [Riemerella anatipestifer]
MKKALADTNNDGQKDAFLTIYENLPTGADAQAAGFQIGDILVFSTPKIVNSIDGTTLLTQQYSYKKATVVGDTIQRIDSIDGPVGEPQRNIIDWVSGALSTQEIDAIQTSIYPNPTTDKVMVKLLEAKGVKEYRVYAVDGKLVLSGKALSAKDAIDVSGLSAGMYVLQLDIDGKITTHKLIKK